MIHILRRHANDVGDDRFWIWFSAIWAINPIARRLPTEHQLNTANLNPGLFHLSQLWKPVQFHTVLFSLENLLTLTKKNIHSEACYSPTPLGWHVGVKAAWSLFARRTKDTALKSKPLENPTHPSPLLCKPSALLHEFLRVVSKMSINYNCDWRRSRAELRYLNCNLLSALPISIQIVENCNRFWNQTLSVFADILFLMRNVDLSEWIGKKTPFLACHNILICTPWPTYWFHRTQCTDDNIDDDIFKWRKFWVQMWLLFLEQKQPYKHL